MAAKVVSVPLEPLSASEQVLQGGVRLDGRGYEEFRPACEYKPVAQTPVCQHAALSVPQHVSLCVHAVVSTKTLSQATGSAYAEFANTKVMVAV